MLEALRGVYHNDALTREQENGARRTPPVPSGALWPADERSAGMDGGAFTGAQNGPEFRAGQSHLLLAESLDAADTFLAAAGRADRQQHRERAWKKAILNRKDALFYKTVNGAWVGNLFMSLIHTCELNGANPFDYLTELQDYARALKQTPSEWMPWNYRATLARLAGGVAA